MPRLWHDTISTHRRAVREAALDTTAVLVDRHGLRGVTMSQIAEEIGIGRATLYKYFPDIDAILRAWHERQIERHLAHLVHVRDDTTGAAQRLEAVFEAYALLASQSHGHRDAELASFLHRDERVVDAERQLRSLIQDLLIEGVDAGVIRDDIRPDELAGFCVHALAAARGLASRAAIKRLVAVTLAGLRPPT